jgi:hypothetical protein
MNKLITVIFMGLFIPAFSDYFTHGFVAGYGGSSISRSKIKKSNRHLINETNYSRYNYMCVDTGDVDFPPDYSPQCIESKKRVPSRPICISEKITILFLLISSLSSIFYIIICGTDDDKDFLCGVCCGAILECCTNDD